MRTNVAIAKGRPELSCDVRLGAVIDSQPSITDHAPEPFTIGWIAVCALGVNLLSVLLLITYKDGDANVRSIWLCSRNDAIGSLHPIWLA